eukprot:10678285-Karenia_brevis.AAC.1
MIFVLKHTRGRVEVCPDAKVFADGFNAGRPSRPDGVHAELWAKIGELCADREVTVRKVDAHISDEDFIRGARDIADEDFVGNKYADVLAGKGAALHQVSPTEVRNTASADGMAVNILKRLVA